MRDLSDPLARPPGESTAEYLGRLVDQYLRAAYAQTETEPLRAVKRTFSGCVRQVYTNRIVDGQQQLFVNGKPVETALTRRDTDDADEEPRRG
jgi:hypothetical protein